MKNREQIRARNALRALENNRNLKGQGDGNVLSGFPALIVNNGLLATLAFSLKGGGHQAIMDAIEEHLRDPEISLLPENEELRIYLTESDSDQLRLCTAEALAYLNYLKRFAKVT